ncbi:MAG: hypothetical protein IJC40_00205 [Muribaculaceae bacterium]|nr:hypothetical protein [Muribaculaceae bacterium]
MKESLINQSFQIDIFIFIITGLCLKAKTGYQQTIVSQCALLQLLFIPSTRLCGTLSIAVATMEECSDPLGSSSHSPICYANKWRLKNV